MPGSSSDAISNEAPGVSASESAAPYKSPFLWVPSSYLTMGLVYATINNVANIMFKNMGMDNDKAALWSSILGFPYTFKFVWAPLLELYKTKKFFVVLMQILLVGVFALVAFSLKLPGMSWLVPVLGLFALAAMLGATQDIGSDGVYVTTLGPKDQAKYTGVQSMCWSLGPVLATGLLLRLTGTMHEKTGSWPTAWMIIMLITGGIILAMALYHVRMLPAGAKAKDAPRNAAEAMQTFGKAWTTFFQKKGLWAMLAFAFFYRFGYGLVDKMGPLFMIEERSKGGLGLSNQALGDIYGTFGTVAFIVGSALGGLFIARRGLKRTLLILCLCLNVPNVTFLLLSQILPTDTVLITAVVTVEKLAWGIGCVGHMIYMMQQIAPGPYKTAHYTFATALMGACMMLTGAASGYIQKAVGFQWFFVIVLLAAGPSLLATIFAPFHNADVTKRETAKA